MRSFIKRLTPRAIVSFRRRYLINHPVKRFRESRALAKFRKTQKSVFLTFADGNVFRSDRLEREVSATGFFQTIHAYDASNLGDEFYTLFQEHMSHARGFGYWCWKPYLVKKTLLSVDDGDLVVYADSGCSVAEGDSVVFEKLLITLLASDGKFMVAIDPASRYKVAEWTKIDLLKHFGLERDEKTFAAEQWPVGRLAIIKTDANLQLITKWCEVAQNLHFIDDSPSLSLEHACFKEHRHDQAILSLSCL